MQLPSFIRHVLPSLSLLVLVAVLLAGCGASRAPATAQYNAPQDETVYRARSINLGTMFPTGGLSPDPSVEMNSWARCSGEDCRPQRIWLAFSIRGTSQPGVLSNRDVKIRTSENTHTWPDERRRTTGAENKIPGSAGGELTRISMGLGTFRDIATSQRVSGTLGGENFSLSYEERAPLRAMLAKATGDAPSE